MANVVLSIQMCLPSATRLRPTPPWTDCRDSDTVLHTSFIRQHRTGDCLVVLSAKQHWPLSDGCWRRVAPWWTMEAAGAEIVGH